MLALGSVMPGLAVAGEADSEGEGTSPPVELPVPPDFDPGGEETGLGEVPAAGIEEEGGIVEAEPEVDPETSVAGEVTSAGTAAPVEAQPPAPAPAPEPATSAAPEPEPIQQQGQEPAASEPVANQSIVAPRDKPVEQKAAAASGQSGEAEPASEAPAEETPSPPLPQPVTSLPADHGRHLAGKESYVVKPGDCLWHIAAALLPADAGTSAIAEEVERLWLLNEARIGTGDPSLIYAGTTLRLN